MKVLVIGSDKKMFEPNSAVLARTELYAGLCDKMSIIILSRQKFAPIHLGNLSIFATNSCSRLRYLCDALKLVKKILNTEKYDLVTTQDPYDTGIIGWFVKRKYKLSWQCQIHGDILSPYFSRESLMNKIRVFIAKLLLPKADGVRVVSERIKDSLLYKIPKLKANPIVLPIFVNVETLETAEIKINLRQKYKQFDSIILTASRLSKEKNIELQIEAMAEIIKQYPKIGLIIVGDGKEKTKLQKLVKNKSLEKNIIFENWSSDLASYYKTADLFLLTSNYEGWGMTAIEAAACGCPIVMTDVGCAGEFIKNGENGLVVGIGDKKALAEAVEKIISDKDFGGRIREEMKRDIMSLPNQAEYLEAYKKSFEDIIAK
jgi:glycosyltransferase involved in cell wall biosynthesis